MMHAFSRKNLWEKLPPTLKSSVGMAVCIFSPRLLLGKSFQQWEKLVSQADVWEEEDVKNYQLRKVKEICTLAYNKTAYYRSSFERIGFDPNQMNSLEELQYLPIIDKHVINDHADALLAEGKNNGRVDWVSTGGSSGQPLRFLIGANRSPVEFSHLASAWYRTGYTLTTPLAVLRGNVIKNTKSGLRFYYDPLLRRHNYSSFHMNDESMGGYLSHISAIGPCYLHAYPSTLNMLVRYIHRSGKQPPKNIKGLLLESENVYQEDRKAAEELFDVRYFSCYGHSEKLVMAAECEHSADYHVFPTYGYCELVDGNGRPVTTPGQTGEIVGTGFINKVMPFIRYRTGDYATYVGTCCKHCGRHQLIISNIRGHNTQEMLVAKDGSLIPWSAVNTHDDTFYGVLQFQFEQFHVGRSTLKVVPARTIADSELIAKLTTGIENRLQGRLDFDVQIVDEIELTNRGKSVFVKQHLDIGNLIH